MRCPLTAKFGHDVAGLIYKMMWQQSINVVNTQFMKMHFVCASGLIIRYGKKASTIVTTIVAILFGTSNSWWLAFFLQTIGQQKKCTKLMG